MMVREAMIKTGKGPQDILAYGEALKAFFNDRTPEGATDKKKKREPRQPVTLRTDGSPIGRNMRIVGPSSFQLAGGSETEEEGRTDHS